MPLLNDLAVRLRADVNNFNRGLDSARGRVDEFANKNRTLGDVLNNTKERLLEMNPAAFALAGALAAATAAVVKLTIEQIRAAEQLQKTAIRTNTTTEELSQLRFAVEQAGGSFDGLTLGLRTLNRTAAEAAQGNKQFADIYQRLGVNVTDTNGRLKSGAQLLEEVSDGLNRFASSGEKAALGTRILGEDAFARLLPLLESGSEGIRAAREEADQLGLTVSTSFATQSAVFLDEIGRLRAAGTGLAQVIAEQMLPALLQTIQALTEAATTVVPAVRDAVEQLNFQLQRAFAFISSVVAKAGELLGIEGAAQAYDSFNAVVNQTIEEFREYNQRVAEAALQNKLLEDSAKDAAETAQLLAKRIEAVVEAARKAAAAQELEDLTGLLFGPTPEPRRLAGEEVTEEGARRVRGPGIEGLEPEPEVPLRVDTSGFDTALGEAQIFFDSVVDLGRTAFSQLDSFSQNFARGLVDAAAGAKVRFGDFFEQLLKDLAAAIARALVLRTILGLVPGLGGFFGSLQNIIGGPLGGGAVSGAGGPIFAGGGLAAAGAAASAGLGITSPPQTGDTTAQARPTVIINEPSPLTTVEFIDRNVVPRLRDRRDDFGSEGF